MFRHSSSELGNVVTCFSSETFPRKFNHGLKLCLYYARTRVLRVCVRRTVVPVRSPFGRRIRRASPVRLANVDNPELCSDSIKLFVTFGIRRDLQGSADPESPLSFRKALKNPSFARYLSSAVLGSCKVRQIILTFRSLPYIISSQGRRTV